MFNIVVPFALICIFSFAASQECGYNVTGISGSIQSPNYPNGYEGYLDCYYTLTTLEGTYMILEIVDLDFNDDYDYLYIYDGPNITNTLLGQYSNEASNVFINATTNQVLVRFYTDYDGYGRGFNVTFHTNVCSNDLTATSGTILSPFYPQPYYDNMECFNRLSTPANTIVTLHIESLDLESCCDYLKIYDGPTNNDKVIGAYTGQQSNVSITTSTNQVLLYLHSDSSNAYGGYSIYFSGSEQCGEEVSASYGSVVSHGYPYEPYENNQDCYYKITTSPDTAVAFNIADITLELDSDRVEIYDGHSTSSPMIGKYTGVQSNVTAYASTNEALIHFHTDGSGQNKGFYIYFDETETEICPAANYYADAGVIESPSVQGSYPNNVNCYYNVQTSPNTQITLHVSSLDVELSDDCAKDFLEIYDGPTNSSKLLIKVCGVGPVNDIVSSSNEVFVYFHSDRDTNSGGFSISYNTKACLDPVQYTDEFGSIYSPGFPSSKYPNNADCKYAVVVPPESIVQFTVTYMEVENSDNCQSDYVRIYDGPDENHPLLADLCGNYTSGDFQTSTNKVFVIFHSDASNNYRGFSIAYTAAYY